MKFSALIAAFVALALISSGGGNASAQTPGPLGIQALERLKDLLLPLFDMGDAIVYVDADEYTRRIVVAMSPQGRARESEVLDRAPLLGVATDLIDIKTALPIYQHDTLRDSVRPLEGGLQINFDNDSSWGNGSFLCTYGFTAVRNGVNGFVTNSHCTAQQGGVQSTSYHQPTQSAAPTKVGTEIADPTYRRISGCSWFRICRRSDSAFVRIDNGTPFEMGKIAKPSGIGSTTIVGQFTITGEGTASTGQTINKVGRTSGWGQGTQIATCIDVNVSGTNITQLCQNMGNYDSQGGDSGSPVFRIDSGDNVTLLGINWGGDGNGVGVYSPIENIEQELGALTTTGSGSPPADPAPTVTSKSPANGATNVAVSTNVTATFSEAIVPDPDGSDFTLVCDNNAVAGAFSYSSGSRTMTFNPSADLPESASCTATILAANVRDSANQPLAANEVWSFTTAGPAPPVTNCTAPVITSSSDSSPSGTGSVSFAWDPVPGATQYTIQRSSTFFFFTMWSTVTTTSQTSFSGSDGSGDPQWRIYVSAGTCTGIPGPMTTFDP